MLADNAFLYADGFIRFNYMNRFKCLLVFCFIVQANCLAQSSETVEENLQERLIVLEQVISDLGLEENYSSKGVSDFDRAIYACCEDMKNFDSCCARACDLIWGPGGHICRAECSIGAVHKRKCNEKASVESAEVAN